MKTLVLIALLVVARAAGACTPAPFPSNAVTIVGQQGRPLPNTTISITDVSGVPIGAYGGAFTDPSGCTPSTIVDPTGVYQFFTVVAGEWIVTVQGQGLTRRYYTTSGIGVGGVATSIDRTAEVMIGHQSDTLQLFCDGGRIPCGWHFVNGFNNFVFIDFIMPSFRLVLSDILLSWVPMLGSNGTAVWSITWASYKSGEAVTHPSEVDPTGLTLLSTAPSDTRTDVSTTINPLPDWQPQDHVVIFIWFVGADARNTISGPLFLENVRLEFVRP